MPYFLFPFRNNYYTLQRHRLLGVMIKNLKRSQEVCRVAVSEILNDSPNPVRASQKNVPIDIFQSSKRGTLFNLSGAILSDSNDPPICVMQYHCRRKRGLLGLQQTTPQQRVYFQLYCLLNASQKQQFKCKPGRCYGYISTGTFNVQLSAFVVLCMLPMMCRINDLLQNRMDEQSCTNFR